MNKQTSRISVQTNEQTNSVLRTPFDDEKRLKRRGRKRARTSQTVLISLARNYQAGLRRRKVSKPIPSSIVPFDARLGERITFRIRLISYLAFARRI